ncbi:uncharacterized protein LOC119508157 [Choloepus didactylus]|uniref:uncharacterized protein LOC119508157 n=1 Tax=Choloepus didactylus TaxID=27675 RepID=UPI00189D6173|nr:uncharacterized protein LOC119508157 [Choloepus didactylus]
MMSFIVSCSGNDKREAVELQEPVSSRVKMRTSPISPWRIFSKRMHVKHTVSIQLLLSRVVRPRFPAFSPRLATPRIPPQEVGVRRSPQATRTSREMGSLSELGEGCSHRKEGIEVSLGGRTDSGGGGPGLRRVQGCSLQPENDPSPLPPLTEKRSEQLTGVPGPRCRTTASVPPDPRHAPFSSYEDASNSGCRDGADAPPRADHVAANHAAP